jgi:hypothetical protein
MFGSSFDELTVNQRKFLGILELEPGCLIKVSHPYKRNKRIIGIIIKKKITLAKSEHDVAHGLITLFSAEGITYHSLTSAEVISKI